MRILKRVIIGLGAVIVVGYLAALGYMYVFQRDIQYDTHGRMYGLDETTLTTAELVSIPSDGTAIAGWYAPPPAGKPVILYFRGNAHSFSREHERFEAFVADGYGFLSFDYRGFPGSRFDGEVTQDTILEDSLAAYDWLAAKGLPIVLWGRSLGSGPATYIASVREANALLLETPFDSAVAVAVDRYWFLPVGLLMKDQFPVDQWIRAVAEPVFVAVASADTVIARHHGQRVYDLAPDKAGLWIEEGADHSDLWRRGIWERVKPFFAATEAAR